VILTPAQNEIAADLHRFRVLNCGRRFGKTTLAIEEMKGKAIGKPSRICYIAPTIQQARDIAWQTLKHEMRPVAISIKEAPSLEIRVKTVQGGESTILLRGWEAVDTLRGQAFDFLVLDEVASMRNFWVGWDEVLSPTLLDRKGEALFISTPKGFNHFYDLFHMEQGRVEKGIAPNPDFKGFHYTTYDNPFIPIEEIEREKRGKPENAFAQEYLADFRKSEGLVYKEFDRQQHVYTEIPQGTTVVETLAGVDWGFIHPAAVLTIDIDRTDNLWVKQEFYERGRTDIEVAEYTAALRANRVFPDPESANAAEELRRRSVNIRPVVKGKDSEKHGIDRVRDMLKASKLHVHYSCKNLISEFETHAYKNNGDPEDEGEDALDALRYVVMMIAGDSKITNDKQDDDYGPTYSTIGI
jgi:hypothetical protein